MLEGIKEKMLELLYDIEEEVGKENKLYVHAYDVYVDVLEMEKWKKMAEGIGDKMIVAMGNDLSDEIFKEEAQDGM